MKTSSRVLMALLGGVSAFVLASPLSPIAHAAPGTFTPTNSWNINRIDPKNSSAPYCTLARSFTGNTVVTFARNTTGEGTIAIDFKQSLFDPRQTYRIGLQAGDGIRREFMTRPATAAALVLRTGEDEAFFKALSTSTELGVIMDDTRYAFSLPDFGVGVNQLQNCITTSQVVNTQAAASNAELRAMEAELSKLRTENKSIVSTLKTESARRASASSSPETAELLARINTLELEKNELVERLQNEQGKEVRGFTELKEALEEQKNLRNLLEQERNQRQKLEATLNHQTAEAEQRGELRARIGQLENSNAELVSLRKTVEQERTQRQAAESRAASSLEEQERLRASLDDASNNIAQERARRVATEKELGQRDLELKSLQTQLETAQKNNQSNAEITRLQNQIRTLQATQADAMGEQARRAAAEGTVREMQARIAERDQSIQSLKEQLEATRQNSQNNAETARLQSQIKTLEAAQTEAVSEQARRIAAENTVRELQAKIADFETKASNATAAEIARLKSELDTARKAQPDSRSEIAALQARLEAEMARRKASERAVSELQNRHYTAPENSANSASSAEAENLRRQLKVLQQDNEQLATRLSSLANQPAAPVAVDAGRVVYTGGDPRMVQTLAETQASLEAATAERNEYRNLLQRERARERTERQDNMSTAGTNARITALEGERAELIRQLEFERSRLSQIAQGQETAPSADMARLSERLANLEAEKSNLEKQLRITQQDVIEARNIARNQAPVAPANAASNADVAELLSENRRLQQELAASASRPATGNAADMGALKSEIAALRAQNKVLNDEVARRLAAAPDRADIQNAHARADYANQHAASQATAQVADELSRARTRFEQAEAENIRLARELAATRTSAMPLPSATHPVQTPVAQPPQTLAQAPQTPMAQPSMQRHASAGSAISRPIVDTPADSVGTGSTPYASAPVYQPASLSPTAVQSAMDPYANAGPDGRLISNYLQRAGVPMVGGFEKITRVSTADFAAFRWDTGVVFGTAEQQMSSGPAVNLSVQQYLQKTRERCSGTYDESVSHAGNVTTADVACIMPDGNGAGAAVVFFYKDGLMNVVAHEGTLDTFDQAMNTRDRFATFVRGQM